MEGYVKLCQQYLIHNCVFYLYTPPPLKYPGCASIDNSCTNESLRIGTNGGTDICLADLVWVDK